MKRAIALITTIMMAALLTVLIGTALFLASKAIFVTGGEERFSSAYDAAEGGIERGIWKIKRYLEGLDVLDNETVAVGSYTVDISPSYLFSYTRPGYNLRFASAYLGLGHSQAGGGIAQIYFVFSDARHPKGQRAQVEVLRVVPTGIPGGE